MMMEKLKRRIVLLIVTLFLFSGSVSIRAENGDEYKLKEVVVLSRHNIRAPLSTAGSALDTATPHTWYSWSSNASELSLRGGILETAMGQYFRKWLEDEELIPQNYRPENNEVRFYANAKQRTIATAQYFSSGFLPVANVEIITRTEYDKMDPVFTPQLTFVNDKYKEDAIKQMKALIPDLSKEYALLSEVIDLDESEDYKNGKLTEFKNGDVELSLEVNAEPSMKGSLKTATSLADALVLQYYEQEDEKAAAFNHEITADDWKSIARIKDVYGDVLFTAPLISVNVAHPLLKEIRSELQNDTRIFSFLCGHDSNIGSVLAALGIKNYEVPEAIEAKTPIGSKLVFEKWEKNGEEYIRLGMIYNSVDQIRDLSIMDLDNVPMSYYFKIDGLSADSNGMYKMNDFMSHLNKAINAYDDLLRTYDPDGSYIPATGIE